MAEPEPPPPPKPPAIDAVFRNGSLTAISVIVGFSLSFLNRWAALPGAWTHADLAAVAAISIGIAAQVVAVMLLLSYGSMLMRRYKRAVRIFLAGLILVALGILLAIAGDILGFEQTVLRG